MTGQYTDSPADVDSDAPCSVCFCNGCDDCDPYAPPGTVCGCPPIGADHDDDQEHDDLSDLAACRVCGCTDAQACEGGCHWVPDPWQHGELCSACLPADPADRTGLIAAILDVINSGDPAKVRDGLPTADELLAACRLLQIPIDRARMGLDKVSDERQRTHLLAVLAVWTTGYQWINDQQYDRLTHDELEVLVSNAESELSGDGNGATALNLLLWRTNWNGYVVEAVGRNSRHDPTSPTEVLVNLLRAVLCVATDWQAAAASDGFAIDGIAYSVVEDPLTPSAVHHTVQALKQIKKLIGPRPPKGTRK